MPTVARRSRIGGPLPGTSEAMSVAHVALQLASDLGDVTQFGPLRTSAAVLRVILDTIQVRFIDSYRNFRYEENTTTASKIK